MFEKCDKIFGLLCILAVSCGYGCAEVRNGLFEELCSGPASGDAVLLREVAGRSKLDCASVCSWDSACTALEYDGTNCRLFENSDVTCTNNSSNALTSGVFVKVATDWCPNGGTLNADGQCSCALGYSGHLCQTYSYNGCASSPCLNSGVCEAESSGSYHCNCPVSHTGFMCEQGPIVVDAVQADNGGMNGAMGPQELCPFGSFAASWTQKVDLTYDAALTPDDTGLSGVALNCHYPSSFAIAGNVTSVVGPEGSWGNVTSCPSDYFMVGVRMQVQAAQGGADDTAVNSLSFRCRGPTTNGTAIVVVDGDGAFEGSYGAWSTDCPSGTVICSILILLDGDSLPDSEPLDNSSVNNVWFSCCRPY